jgi:hypothetical protein
MPENYTLTYSEGSKGFPSFYSYFPDYMIGMNQYFYTFKGGNLFRHNVNSNYNTFYGTTYDSTISTVFNEQPLQNKIFKTINLESDDAWSFNGNTDIQNNGYITAGPTENWYERKEGDWFAFIRTNNNTGADVTQGAFELRSLNGIGRSVSENGPAAVYEILFNLNVNIGSIVSVGDYLYFSVPPYDTPQFAGVITDIQVDKVNGINQLVIDTTTVAGTTYPVPINDAYFLYIKNPIAESHGILGHYCEFTLTLDKTIAINPSELFAVESEVMKSFP